jgi:hypothetical protein
MEWRLVDGKAVWRSGRKAEQMVRSWAGSRVVLTVVSLVG